MKKSLFQFSILGLFLFLMGSCSNQQPGESKATADNTTKEDTADFQYLTEQFADVKIIRYQIPGWDALPLKDKILAYYLSEAAYAGRDIMYDQNYRYNLTIRNTFENIYRNYTGDKSSADWKAFEVYLKRLWFSNGIHHHYSYVKFTPKFSRAYLEELLSATNQTLSDEVMAVIFDPSIDNKKVSKDPTHDLVLNSAVNFYGPKVSQEDVNNFKDKKKAQTKTENPISYGLNSKIVENEDGTLSEKIWKVGGMYSPAIENMIKWLEKAKNVTESEQQALALGYLIDYYKTGDLVTWNKFNIAWVNDTTSTVDFIHGFVEVYNDPLGLRGSYESIVEIRDLEASSKMKVLSDHAQYFEDNSPIMDEHKKKEVVGITYNFINVVAESGDASPSTPIGVNLPNANWIRAQHGSKSVSLGNIVRAYSEAGTTGFLKEFSNDSTEIELSKKYSKQAGKLHTALHEVIGHASGKLNPGVAPPKETLKNYSSTLEEARADLVALYFMMDPKLVELGVMDNLDVGHEAYDSYIKNGMMLQLRRLKPGQQLEEDHMRNRQLVAHWVFEKGMKDSVITEIKRNGNTYFNINDYEKLQDLFGQLLREIQRIKSEGDYDAARALVEKYGVKVDPELHAEVLARTAKFESAPYGGFINPRLVPVMENGEIVDVNVEYPKDFATQMLEYSEKYSSLPNMN